MKIKNSDFKELEHAIDVFFCADHDPDVRFYLRCHHFFLLPKNGLKSGLKKARIGLKIKNRYFKELGHAINIFFRADHDPDVRFYLRCHCFFLFSKNGLKSGLKRGRIGLKIQNSDF